VFTVDTGLCYVVSVSLNLNLQDYNMTVFHFSESEVSSLGDPGWAFLLWAGKWLGAVPSDKI
jgi:hypothetical protein